jgi:hypothetical protein
MRTLPYVVRCLKAQLPVLLVPLAVACGGSNGGSAFDGGAGGDASTHDGSLRDSGHATDGPKSLGNPDTGATDAAETFEVEPSTLQTIPVTAGQSSPTVVFTATLGGIATSAAWGVDNGEIGSITSTPSAKGTFTPSGSAGGLVNIVAGLNGKTLKRQVFVKLTSKQNGPTVAESSQVPTTVAQIGAGGGIGGVGGEGLGAAVTDAATLAALANPTGDAGAPDAGAMGLTFLYPYDQTVFPRGLLAPLLQWQWAPGNADAIAIKLSTTSGSFSWSGTFAAPAILSQTMGSFIRSPIPQDVWAAATDTAGSTAPGGVTDQLMVSLVVAKGGVGYGPIKETWTIAPARLSGTVYYNSYGTQLVQNSTDHDHNGVQYGAAVLSITEGATGPTVVAGAASDESGTGCRVCHSVASGGSRLIVQHGDSYATTSTYTLTQPVTETLAFTNAADLAAGTPASQLYAFPPTAAPATPLAATGIPANLQAGTPSFSPDGTHIAFDFLGGTIGTTTGNGTQLVSLDFDSTTLAFTNLRVLATMPGTDRAGFPSFYPTNDAVAFHYQLVNSSHEFNTWQGAEAQIWWSDLATGTSSVLGALNGLNPGGTTSYLPVGANNHANDTVLNYEPTVNPVASGGYVWVVFTSRRLYGNVATQDPWLSDPRGYDNTNVALATDKKLWVAAIDLNAPAGSDKSHPAFYLPAQELLAGNARGFWVLDPCRQDGTSCESGDECCNGYCEPGTGDAGLVCSNTPPNANCSQPEEKCTTSANCCDPTNTCVNGFCSIASPP